MKKTTYDFIIEAKNIVAEAIDEGVFNESTIQYLNKLLYELKHISVKEATALATVLACGCFHESLIDGYRFDLPSTKDCMANYHAVKRLMNKGRTIPIYVYHEEAC